MNKSVIMRSIYDGYGEGRYITTEKKIQNTITNGQKDVRVRIQG